jgi:hypothetical protein
MTDVGGGGELLFQLSLGFIVAFPTLLVAVVFALAQPRRIKGLVCVE